MNVDKIASFINKSKFTQKVLRATSDNPALVSAGIGAIAASLLRPALQGALPIKDKKDRAYTIASSVSAGLTELGTAALIFIPANKGIQKLSKSLYSSTKNTIYKENSMLLRQFKSLSNRFLKLLLLPLTSWLRFATVPLTVSLLYGKEKPKVGGKLNREG